MVPVIVSIGNLTRTRHCPMGVATSSVSAVPVLTKVVRTRSSPSYAQRRWEPSETTTSLSPVCHRPGPGSVSSWASIGAGAESVTTNSSATTATNQAASSRAGRGKNTAELLSPGVSRGATRVVIEQQHPDADGQAASLRPTHGRWRGRHHARMHRAPYRLGVTVTGTNGYRCTHVWTHLSSGRAHGGNADPSLVSTASRWLVFKARLIRLHGWLQHRFRWHWTSWCLLHSAHGGDAGSGRLSS